MKYYLSVQLTQTKMDVLWRHNSSLCYLFKDLVVFKSNGMLKTMKQRM